MVYIFNELSLKKVGSRQETANILGNFVESVIGATELGFTELRLYENVIPTLYQIQLSDSYSIDDWLSDPQIDTNLRDRFRDILTSFPLITENEVKENELYGRSEFTIVHDKLTHQVWGLGAAYIYETLSISLKTHYDWEVDTLNISHYTLNLEGNESIKEVNVRHFLDLETLSKHVDWFNKLKKSSINKSQELWIRREEFFPNLILCEEVEKQLQKLGLSKIFYQIIERLKGLNDYIQGWEEGNFNYEDANLKTNLRISPESETTLKKFGTLRKFSIPGGGKKIFDLHIKTGDLRFHFYPDNNTKKVYVGYIGKHLRISSQD